MGRQVATSVRITDKDGRQVVLAPGDELPDWAADQVTNDAVFGEQADEPEYATAEAASEAEGEGGAAFEEYADDEVPVDDVPSYDSMKVTELRGLIEQRNAEKADGAKIATDGTKSDLIAALEADDRA